MSQLGLPFLPFGFSLLAWNMDLMARVGNPSWEWQQQLHPTADRGCMLITSLKWHPKPGWPFSFSPGRPYLMHFWLSIKLSMEYYTALKMSALQQHSMTWMNMSIKQGARVPQQFSATFSLGCDPGDLGSSPALGSLHGACFSLCLYLCLSLPLPVSLMNE